MKVALLVIDMQVGLFQEATPRYDAENVIDRINGLARVIRTAGGTVIFVQHDGPPGDDFEPGSNGWQILPTLERTATDITVRKRACDAFYETDLANILTEQEIKHLIVAGCATDFCVDTTIRAAASRDYEVTAVADGHTTADRPHLEAIKIIQHHNWVWENLILPRSRIMVRPAMEIVDMLQVKK